MSRFKPGQSGNPAGRPRGSRNTKNKELIACLKKFGPDGVDAIGSYLQHYKLVIEEKTSKIEELQGSLDGLDEKAAIEQKRLISSLDKEREGAYENYYKAGGKLADLMQNMLKHEEAPGSKKSEATPAEDDLPAVFSSTAR